MFSGVMKLDTATKQLLQDPEKRRAWVIYQLKLQGESLASVARKSGVTKQQTQKAMSAPYPRMEKVIADALGLKPQHLFPDRYDADGLPNRRMGRPKKSTTKTPKNNTDTSNRNVHARRVA